MNWLTLLYLPLTILIYIGAQKLSKRFPTPLFNPVLLTIVSLALMLLALDIEYVRYNEYNQYLTELLQPAVVALGVPLYQQLHAIKKELLQIVIIVAIAVVIAISSTVALALVLKMTPEIAISLAPKSVTTPIAVLIAEQTQGLASLAAIAVIVTGLVGAVIGVSWLKWTGVKTAKSQGVAMGTACHALGTARIAEESTQHGAYSALAMVLSATFSAILAPIIIPLIV